MQVDCSKGYYSTQKSVFQKRRHDVSTGTAKNGQIWETIQEIIYTGLADGLNMAAGDKRDFWLVQPHGYEDSL